MKYLIYIVVFFFLLSCKKDATIMVTTVNKVTGAPMPGITIYVSEDLSWDPINTAQGAFYYGETDQNGNLVINIEMRNNGKYTITQSLAENSCWHSDKALSLEKTKNQNVTFEFAPCAQLKLKIENVNCEGAGDEIFYQRHWLSGNESTNGVTQTGCFQYDGSYFNVPMGAFRYTWDVTRNGVTESFEEEFYIEEGGQYELEILY